MKCDFSFFLACCLNAIFSSSSHTGDSLEPRQMPLGDISRDFITLFFCLKIFYLYLLWRGSNSSFKFFAKKFGYEVYNSHVREIQWPRGLAYYVTSHFQFFKMGLLWIQVFFLLDCSFEVSETAPKFDYRCPRCHCHVCVVNDYADIRFSRISSWTRRFRSFIMLDNSPMNPITQKIMPIICIVWVPLSNACGTLLNPLTTTRLQIDVFLFSLAALLVFFRYV